MRDSAEWTEFPFLTGFLVCVGGDRAVLWFACVYSFSLFVGVGIAVSVLLSVSLCVKPVCVLVFLSLFCLPVCVSRSRVCFSASVSLFVCA